MNAYCTVAWDSGLIRDNDLSAEPQVLDRLLGSQPNTLSFMGWLIQALPPEAPASYFAAGLSRLSDIAPFKLLRHCFVARWPRYWNSLFTSNGAPSVAEVVKLLRDCYTLLRNLPSTWTQDQCATMWVICCRMAQDAFDLDQHLNGLGNNDGDWPARFSDSVRTGREIPALNDETRFRVAIRWALAVLEDWPAHRDGRVIVFEAPEVVVFAARFFDGDPIRGWRAAAYLAVEERGLFEALLKHVHGIRLGQRRIPITAALASQHGLDHLVAMVGAKTVGKTSFLLSLAEAGILEYRQVNGDTGWLTIDAADPPRSSWRDNFQFDTLPSNHLNMQGREARVTEGLRLIAYDAAGETVAFGNVGDGREYDTFFKVLSPSALIFIVSSVDKLNPKDANENAITAVSEIIDGNPEFPRDIPVFILFNKADTWFDERDERRSTLLGPQSVLLDAATLDGSGEFKGLSSLLQALETDEFMAANPLEGSAYTQALTEFGTCIDPVLQRFRRVVFGFMCCLGGAAGDSLRLSNQVIWQSLQRHLQWN